MRTELYAITTGKPTTGGPNTNDVETIPKHSYNLQISPQKAAIALGVIVLLLALAHTACVAYFLSHQESFVAQQSLRLFILGNDGNIPTLFSAFILLTACVLLFYISKTDKRRAGHKDQGRWKLLSAIFLFLSVDEGAMIHDFLSEGIRSKLHADIPDFLYLSWVIPYFFLVVAVAIYYAKFLLQLPAKTRNLFIVSGFIYVFGAIGFELIESSFIAKTNVAEVEEAVKPLPLYVYELIEEGLEMGGIVLFIYALLDYLKGQGKTFYIHFASKKNKAGHP